MEVFLYNELFHIHRNLQKMPDLSDISKENVKKGKMGGSASNAGDKFSRNPYNHDDEKQLTAEERKAVSIERPSRPIPPNRPLPVLSVLWCKFL